MHQYVIGLAALKTMIRMIYEELDRGAKSVNLDATEARFHFQKDVIMDYANTIIDYQAWNHLATIDHQENVNELVFPQLPESQ